jgi:hypothetical protein
MEKYDRLTEKTIYFEVRIIKETTVEQGTRAKRSGSQGQKQ